MSRSENGWRGRRVSVLPGAGILPTRAHRWKAIRPDQSHRALKKKRQGGQGGPLLAERAHRNGREVA
ncbi:MAG: hypothetical protein ACREIQ_07390 [Nitrospiria bacterium]